MSKDGDYTVLKWRGLEVLQNSCRHIVGSLGFILILDCSPVSKAMLPSCYKDNTFDEIYKN